MATHTGQEDTTRRLHAGSYQTGILLEREVAGFVGTEQV